MSAKVQASINPISHDAETVVRGRVAIALKRSADLRSDLNFYATTQSSRDSHLVKQ